MGWLGTWIRYGGILAVGRPAGSEPGHDTLADPVHFVGPGPGHCPGPTQCSDDGQFTLQGVVVQFAHPAIHGTSEMFLPRSRPVGPPTCGPARRPHRLW